MQAARGKPAAARPAGDEEWLEKRLFIGQESPVNARRPRSPYAVLNVSPEAEPVVIEAAYRALIKKYHPDHVADAPMSRDAAEINLAYALLRDPARRAEHDHKEWVRQQSVLIANLPAVIPPRRARGRRAAGWALAIVAGAAIGLSLAGSISIATPGERGGGRAGAGVGGSSAAAPRPALDPELRSPEEEVAAFLSTHLQPAAGTAETVHVEPAAVQALPAAAVEPEEPEQVAPRPAPPVRTRARIREQPSALPARAGESEDFLEREGYIY